MPALAARSLWEAVSPSLSSNVNPLLSGSAFPTWVTQGELVVINLFSQTLTNPAPTTSPNNPGYFSGVNLSPNPVLIITLPDKSTVAISSANALWSNPVTGQYTVGLSTFQSGRYGYTWYVGSQSVFSGEFFANPVA